MKKQSKLSRINIQKELNYVKIKLEPNASGTGTLTIAAPNTNTDRSITIPDKAGAIAVGAGTIVQVVQATKIHR